MQKKILVSLKIVSILAVFLINLPYGKFSVPFGVSILAVLSDRIADFNFSLDALLPILFISGITLVFRKDKWLTLIGYTFVILPLILFILAVFHRGVDIMFWIPLFVFLLTFGIVIYQSFFNRASNCK